MLYLCWGLFSLQRKKEEKKNPVLEWQCPQSSSCCFQWPPNEIRPTAALGPNPLHLDGAEPACVTVFLFWHRVGAVPAYTTVRNWEVRAKRRNSLRLTFVLWNDIQNNLLYSLFLICAVKNETVKQNKKHVTLSLNVIYAKKIFFAPLSHLTLSLFFNSFKAKSEGNCKYK